MADNKNVINQNETEKVRTSIGRKAFISVLILALVVGLVLLLAGSAIYVAGMAHEYSANTWNQANAEAAVIDQTNYKALCDRILGIYDSCTDEERGDGQSEEYIARYAGIRESEDFQEVLNAMHSLQNRNGPLNAFMVALDPETNRMIYLVDADQKEDSTCKPGTWDEYPNKELDVLINGRRLTQLERLQGTNSGIQAVFTNRVEYGPRCTAGSTLYQTDKYTIMVCVDEKLDPMIEASKIFLLEYVGLLIVVTLLASYIGMRLMRRAMVDPINSLASAARDYADDDDKHSGKRYFNELDIHSGDELERLAVTLRDMESEVGEYMDELIHVTAEKEHIATELTLAAKIQMSMLPKEFPLFPWRNEFDMFASMEPAKGVGGDFYDMILIDDDHLAIEIADVSGKGIPAALFMMVSKIMLADAVRVNNSPSSILRDVNKRIVARNDEEMFVTVWLGILEISTGRMITANAGHEYPVLIHADGTSELIKDKHGVVLGVMEDVDYPEYEIQLYKGDSLFVYTDGVTEATSETDELYGIKRTLKAAGSASPGAGPEQILKTIREDISTFIGDAEQFDDLTMLCLKYNGADMPDMMDMME